MSGPSDPLTGVKSFSIGGRMIDRRQRCLGMTDEERRWRAQWLKDQVLSHEEPKEVPEFYKETTHFVRRIWKTPMNKFQKLLEPSLGPSKAYLTRHFVGKGIFSLLLAFGVTYFFKYHTNNFELCRSVEFFHLNQRMYPDHPGYPKFHVRKPFEYYDLGFYSSVLCQKAKPRAPVLRRVKPKKVKPKKVVEEVPVEEEEEVICEPPQPDED